MDYARTFPLEGLEIRRSGGGRDVEAYAAVFDTPAEIHDNSGHYMEVIDRHAFDQVLAEGVTPRVLYHHGFTLHGTPSQLGAVPIGTPLSVKTDHRGLLTVTRFNRTLLGDSVLEAIRAGDIKGFSFVGAIGLSVPHQVPWTASGDELPTVRRYQLGLREYGPTPHPIYRQAEIVSVRSARPPVDWVARRRGRLYADAVLRSAAERADERRRDRLAWIRRAMEGEAA